MDFDALKKELQFKAIRSSGSGGQHVNKVSSKVELTFDLHNSYALTTDEKERLEQKLLKRLTKDKLLILYCEETRSQHKNKDLVVKRLFELLKQGLEKPKKRKPTNPSKAAVERRLIAKKKRSDMKNSRRKPKL